MSEKSKAAWQAILAKRRKEMVSEARPETVNENPQTKSGATCGNSMCCMRQARANVTYEGPSIVSSDGYDVGAFAFKGILPPMLCGGSAWEPRGLSRWEQRRRDAKSAPGLADFKKK